LGGPLNEVSEVPHALRHAVFLARATGEPELGTPSARLGQAAFLVLRLVDLLLPGQSGAPDVFLYQASATDRYTRELDVESPEKAHLLAIVKGARDAFTTKRAALLIPALFAYGHFLEETSQYQEALDVLDTLLMVGGEGLAQPDSIATTLRVARVNRKLANFEEAYRWYERAGSLALVAGDVHAEFVSRLGRVNIVWAQGNLAEAEAGFRQVMSDARNAHQLESEARATQGLAVTVSMRGRPAEAIPYAWRAYELHEDAASKIGTLVGLGIMLRDVGDLDSAEQALRASLAASAGTEHGGNAILELLECASQRGDRFGYSRWREEARRREANFTPSMRVDFYLKQGVAEGRFGNTGRCQELFSKALDLAQQHKLHEYVFRIEGLKQNLRESNRLPPVESTEVLQDQSLNAVRASLRELATVD
jgi:tetratricopeptide (TPR) repeat protein